MAFLHTINPESLGAPRGYSNGIVAPPNCRLLFVAGQIAWNEKQEITSSDFPGQLGQALANVLAVVRAAGGQAQHLTQLTIYVTDKQQYLSQLEAVGEAYRSVLGRHFPAMALVEVTGLLDPQALVEIQAIAALPSGGDWLAV